MDLLLSLPQEFCQHVLTDWLPLKPVVLLDRAYLSRKERVEFHALLRGSHFPHFENFHLRRKSGTAVLKYFEWICKRSILISQITLPVLANPTLTTAIAQYLPTCLPSLTAVEFYSVYNPSIQDTDAIVHLVIPVCCNLTALKIDSCDGLSEDLLWLVARSCPHLHHLEVTGGRHITPHTESTALKLPALRTLMMHGTLLRQELLEKLAGATGSLECLVLTYCSLPSQLPDQIQLWSNLLRLNILGDISESVFISIVQCNQNLNAINVTGAHLTLSDDTLFCIAKSCVKLNALTLQASNASDAGLRVLLQKCTNLTHLDIDWNHLTSSSSTICSAIAAFGVNLVSLHINYCHVNISDLMTIGRGCPQLQEIVYCVCFATDHASGAVEALNTMFAARKITARCMNPTEYLSDSEL